MTKSIVYKLDLLVDKVTVEESPVYRIKKLLDIAGINEVVEKGDYVAIKVHLGSEGGYRIIRPPFIKKVVEKVKELGGKPFVTDTCRPPSLDYLEIAKMQGINELSVGAPIIIADGIKGNDYRIIKVNGFVLKEIEVASAIADADAMIVLSHSKGHRQTAYGGAIKNVAMGCTARSTKRKIHSVLGDVPIWDESKCIRCGICVKVCDHNAIYFKNRKVVIDPEKCVRCYRCVWSCPSHALTWKKTDIEKLFMAMADAVEAVLKTFKPGKVLYVNFVMDVMFICDCAPIATLPIVPDQGILASKDIVAIDKASLDLINSAPGIPGQIALNKKVGVLKEGENKFMSIHGVDPLLQVIIAEKKGLGTTNYELKIV